MDAAAAHRLILQYVEGWKLGNGEMILDTLNPECVIIESYGPTYRGTEMVTCWIKAWFVDGNCVTRWDVSSFYYSDDTCFFEWDFQCIFGGNPGGFEGASIARFKNGRIVYLREYAMTAPRYDWQGVWL